MSEPNRRALVVGGTGTLGRPVVKRLLDAGWEVVVGTRNPERARMVMDARAAAVEIDLRSADSITAALDGVDAVHLNLPSGPRFEDCLRNEAEVAGRLAPLARRAGLKRISYLSGTAASPDRGFPPARAKWLAEEAVRESGVPFTIWRATWFMETLLRLVRSGVVILPGAGRAGAHWLAGADYADMVARALSMSEAANRLFYVFGPEALTLREAVHIFRNLIHPDKPILSLPLPLISTFGRLSGRREAWFAAQLLAYLERTGEEGDPGEANELFGAPPTTLAEYARNLR